jgi:hypothetical protein
MKIIITEEEKLSILGLHNKNYVINKKVISEQFDPSNGTYSSKFDQVLRGVQTSNQSKSIKVPAGTKFWHDWNKADDNKVYFRVNNLIYYYDCAFTGYKNIFTDESTLGNWSNDPLSTEIRRYFCNGNKIKTWKEVTKGSNNIQTPPGSAIDGNCKNKNPYNAFTDAGLNWKQERQKWIDAKCNGTTPCILGNATTNINLRNALCGGTWPLKKDEVVTPEQQVVTPEQQVVTPEQQVVDNTSTQVNDTVNNVATQLKQFPNLTFGVKTR